MRSYSDSDLGLSMSHNLSSASFDLVRPQIAHVRPLKVSVIIPTLNEGPGIGPTLEEVIENLSDPEVIVVDGNSVDGTPEIAAHMGAKVITQQGLGKAKAIAQVLRCIDQNTRYLAIIDGDFTYPAKHIPKMIEILEKNPDIGMVTGNRFSNPKEFIAHFRKIVSDRYCLGNQILAIIHRILNRVMMKDPLTGIRVIRFDLLNDLKIKAKSFDIEVELNNYIKRKGSKIIEIPIKYRLRLGKKKLQVRDGFTIFVRMATMALEDISLRLQFSGKNL